MLYVLMRYGDDITDTDRNPKQIFIFFVCGFLPHTFFPVMSGFRGGYRELRLSGVS